MFRPVEMIKYVPNDDSEEVICNKFGNKEKECSVTAANLPATQAQLEPTTESPKELEISTANQELEAAVTTVKPVETTKITLITDPVPTEAPEVTTEKEILVTESQSPVTQEAIPTEPVELEGSVTQPVTKKSIKTTENLILPTDPVTTENPLEPTTEKLAPTEAIVLKGTVTQPVTEKPVIRTTQNIILATDPATTEAPLEPTTIQIAPWDGTTKSNFELEGTVTQPVTEPFVVAIMKDEEPDLSDSSLSSNNDDNSMLILKFGATLPPDFDLNNIDQSLLQPADVNDDTAVELKDYSDFLDNSSKPSSTQNQRILKFIDDRDPKNKKKIVPKSQIKPVDPNFYNNLWTSNSYNYDNKNNYRSQKAQKLVAKIEKIDVQKLLTFDEKPTASPNKKKKLKPVMPVDIDSNYVVLANADYVNTQPVDESAYIESLYQSDYVDMDSFWSQEADLGQGNGRSDSG